MKAAIIIVVVVAVIFGMVNIFGSALNPPDYQTKDAGITGPIELGAVSRADQDVQLWHQPLDSYSAKRREENRARLLTRGTVFVVLNHVPKGSILWVHVRGRDDPTLEGYFKSPPDDPVRATRVD
ncbi:MAG: hypothetical protein ACYTDY_04480 [Planctomycetota bacterium]|jgi:hypothetical protein